VITEVAPLARQLAVAIGAHGGMPPLIKAGNSEYCRRIRNQQVSGSIPLVGSFPSHGRHAHWVRVRSPAKPCCGASSTHRSSDQRFFEIATSIEDPDDPYVPVVDSEEHSIRRDDEFSVFRHAERLEFRDHSATAGMTRERPGSRFDFLIHTNSDVRPVLCRDIVDDLVQILKRNRCPTDPIRFRHA